MRRPSDAAPATPGSEMPEEFALETDPRAVPLLRSMIRSRASAYQQQEAPELRPELLAARRSAPTPFQRAPTAGRHHAPVQSRAHAVRAPPAQPARSPAGWRRPARDLKRKARP